MALLRWNNVRVFEVKKNVATIVKRNVFYVYVTIPPSTPSYLKQKLKKVLILRCNVEARIIFSLITFISTRILVKHVELLLHVTFVGGGKSSGPLYREPMKFPNDSFSSTNHPVEPLRTVSPESTPSLLCI